MHVKTVKEYFNQQLDRWLDGEISSTEFISIISAKMVAVNCETNRCERWESFTES